MKRKMINLSLTILNLNNNKKNSLIDSSNKKLILKSLKESVVNANIKIFTLYFY